MLTFQQSMHEHKYRLVDSLEKLDEHDESTRTSTSCFGFENVITLSVIIVAHFIVLSSTNCWIISFYSLSFLHRLICCPFWIVNGYCRPLNTHSPASNEIFPDERSVTRWDSTTKNVPCMFFVGRVLNESEQMINDDMKWSLPRCRWWPWLSKKTIKFSCVSLLQIRFFLRIAKQCNIISHTV